MTAQPTPTIADWPRSGGCLCGAVRITMQAPPVGIRTCWCRDCQYLAAGSATVNVIFVADTVTIEGELADHVSIADSGNVMHRRFCPRCGTPVLSGSEARPDRLVVRAGAVHDQRGLKPDVTIWTSSAPGYACFDPALPQNPVQPPPVA
jgi:hypothetical protein